MSGEFFQLDQAILEQGKKALDPRCNLRDTYMVDNLNFLTIDG